MKTSRPRVVYDRTGEAALVEPDESDGSLVPLRLAAGQRVYLSPDLVAVRPDGTAVADVVFGDLDLAPGGTLTETEERLHVERRVRETGHVRVHLRTETTAETVDASGWRETIEVERVPVGRVVKRAEGPREDGNTTIVPVYEEQIVVERRLVLAHELHLTRRRDAVPRQEQVSLRRQTVEIERMSADDSPARG